MLIKRELTIEWPRIRNSLRLILAFSVWYGTLMNTRKEVSRKSILSSHIHRVIEFRKNSLMTERDYKAASYLISNRRGLPWYEYMETGSRK